MNGIIRKKMLCVALAITVVFTTCYSAGQPIYASELTDMQNGDIAQEESADSYGLEDIDEAESPVDDSGENEGIEEAESSIGTEEGDDSKETGLAENESESEDDSDAKGTESMEDGSESEESDDSKETGLAENESESEDDSDAKGTESMEDGSESEESDDSKETDLAGTTDNTSDMEGTGATEESESIEGTESTEDFSEEDPFLAEKDIETPPDHSLSIVYWNPNSKNTTSGTGQVLQAGGNDSNSGSTAKFPVLTIEMALKRAASDAIIYCMGYYGTSQSITIDGNYYNVTIKRYDDFYGNIFQITSGNLRLDNITLDGSDSYSDRVLVVGANGTLTIGDSVGNVGETFYFVENSANPVILSGIPEQGTVYNIQFAAGYFENNPILTETTKEKLLIDTSASGLNPEAYFSVSGIPEGWGIYVKDDTQLWARTPLEKEEEVEVYTAIWLDGIHGNDANSGKSSMECVKTWKRAYELYQSKMNGKGIIYIQGTVTVEGTSLEISSAKIERAKDYTGTLFEVKESGKLLIGQDVVLVKEDEDDEEEEEKYYSIICSGALEISADSSVGDKILLLNHDYPMVLKGSGENVYKIGSGGNYEDGDMIVQNGVTPNIDLVEGRFSLFCMNGDSYVVIPEVIYLNGAYGDDTNDGLTPDTAVLTLERAIDVAISAQPAVILVLGGPVQINDGNTHIFPRGMYIGNYTGYSGDIIKISNGTLENSGCIAGNVSLNNQGSLILDGNLASIEADVTMEGDSMFTMESGNVIGKITLSGTEQSTFVQNNGKIKGNVSIESGNFIMNGGTVTEEGVRLENGSTGNFILNGGTIENCKTSINALGGNIQMNGGKIVDSAVKAVYLGANAAMSISGGEIIAKTRDESASQLHIYGSLQITGNPTIEETINLYQKDHPILLETSFANNEVYYLNFFGDYQAEGETITAVKGSESTPAKAENFKLAYDASGLLSLKENGNDIEVTCEEEPEGIYIDSVRGNNNNTGLKSTEAVQNFETAKERLLYYYENEGKEYNIYICNVIKISKEQVWSLEECTWNPVVMRHNFKTDSLIIVSGKLTLENITLDGNQNLLCGKALIEVTGSNAVLEINDGAIIQNCNYYNTGDTGGSRGINGSALHINNYATCILNGGSIRNNRTRISAAVTISREATFIMNSGSIENNRNYNDTKVRSNGSAAGVEVFEGTFTMNGGSIRNNVGEFGLGGGVFIEYGTFILNNGVIEGNRSESYGGGIYKDRFGDLEINGGKIINNSAVYGGGICTNLTYGSVNQHKIVINGGEISGNQAEENGGAIAFENKLDINGGTIKNNEAVNGGAIYFDSGTLNITGGSILENSAAYGGAICWESKRYYDGILNYDGGVIKDNTATQQGDGIFVDDLNDKKNAKISLGNNLCEQTIYLGGNKDWTGIRPLELVSALTDSYAKYEIEVDQQLAKPGMEVIIPDGTNVTNASQYLRNFELKGNSGYALVRDGKNIVLGQAYFVDGVNGNDENQGNTPQSAFKTVEHALEKLGKDAGTIYVCGTITIAAGEEATWTMQPGQSLSRYSGEIVNGSSASSFKEDMIVVEEEAVLNLNQAFIYGALDEEEMEGNGYILVQGGTLWVSEDSSLEYGTVYLKDEKVINIKGSSASLLMEVEKENPAEGDVIGKYESDKASNAANFHLSAQMSDFGLEESGDTVILSQAEAVYVDGVNGKDTNNGLTPEKAFKTMSRAYEKLKAKGGAIYIVDTVSLSDDTTLAAKYYSDAAETIESAGNVRILRYNSNKNPLFNIMSGTTILSGIQIDGEGENVTDHASALITVESGAVLQLEKNAALKNNHSTGEGGAIFNEGTVVLGNCSFDGNTASKGSAIYQAGNLQINSPKVTMGEEEIYLATGAYINIQKSLSDNVVYHLDMDVSDTAEGRVVAVFANGAYGEKGVAEERTHFSINPKTTTKSLTAKDSNTLVLSGDFDVELTGTEFFKKIGDNVTFNVIPKNASPAAVTVSVKNGTEEISCSVKDYNRYKKITIPVTEESIGTLTLSFTSETAVVERTVIISGYEIRYAAGQQNLIARPQDDEKTNIYTDYAEIAIFNGANEQRSFASGEFSIRYDDGSSVEIDSSKISRDMENAMECFGFDAAISTNIPARGTVYIPITFSNGDNLTEKKEGTITLENTVYGTIWTNIDMRFATEPSTRVKVCVNLDDELTMEQDVYLKNTATGEKIEFIEMPLEEKSALSEGLQQILAFVGAAKEVNVWPYQKTGLAEGEYRLYVNDMDTQKTFSVISGQTVCQEINLYTVTYELNGGSWKEGQNNKDIYIEGVGLSSLPIPDRKIANFAGWYEKENLSGDAIGQIGSEANKAYTLYAAWTLKEQWTNVNIEKGQYFEPMGSMLTLEAEIEGVSPENISVQVMRETDSGEMQPVTAEVKDSGSYKLITLEVKEENIGIIKLLFEKKADSEDESKQMTKEIELSAYEIQYNSGLGYLQAKPQEDGVEEVHTDEAKITIYNGSKEERTFTQGEFHVSYEDEPDRKVWIDNKMVEKNMTSVNAMRYFGMEFLEEEPIQIKAGENAEISVVFSNGDMLTENKSGRILMQNAKLGNVSADIPMYFKTEAITRLQICLQMDGEQKNDAVVELRDAKGTTIVVNNISREETSVLEEIFLALTGQENGKWNYQITGLEEGSYQLFVNGLDSNCQVTIKEGEIVQKEIKMYSISYELNQGTMDGEIPLYYIEGTTMDLPVPVKGEEKFEGWYISSDFTGESMLSINEKTSGALHLFAKWEEIPVVQPEEPVTEEPAPETPEPEEIIPEPEETVPETPEPEETIPEPEETAPEPEEEKKESTPKSENKVETIVDTAENSVATTSPQTSDRNLILADIAFVGGLACLATYFLSQNEESGMDEEEKERRIRKIIENAKGKGLIANIIAIGLIFMTLLLYHTFAKTAEVQH